MVWRVSYFSLVQHTEQQPLRSLSTVGMVNGVHNSLLLFHMLM